MKPLNLLRLMPVAALLAGATVTPRAHAGLMLISEKQEIEIGKEVAADAEKEYGGVLHDRKRQARLERVTDKIVAQRKRTGIPYSFKILNNDEVLNAFACPGGPLYITKKLFDQCDTDGKLAFIIGHEVGHTELQHGRKAINKAVMAQLGFKILLGDASDAVQIGVSAVYTLWQQGYSRDQERDADAMGVRFLANAGWDPYEAVAALEMLGGGKLRGLSKYLASHPGTPERIENVKKQIAAEFPDKVKPTNGAATAPTPAVPKPTPPPAPQPQPTPTPPPSAREGTGPSAATITSERSPLAGQQGFMIASDPGGAEVWINGARQGVTPDSPVGTLSQYKFFPVPLGVHAVSIKKVGVGEYQLRGRDQLIRKDEGKRVAVTLGPRCRVTVRVDAAPRPVQAIFVDGRQLCRGAGPGTLSLPRGTRARYPVTVKMSFQQAQGWLSVPDRDTVTYALSIRGSSLSIRAK